MADPLISFVGDDFTGSTDAMESLATEGVRTVLFTRPPDANTLAKYPSLQAFGVATNARSLAAEAMKLKLRPIFQALKDCGSKIVHYKVCSTFDSSPTIGNIGCVIETGLDIFKPRCVPVLVGAPSLGRYCTFGNLFARYGAEGEVFRLDRHPSISKHPVTPMTEADLRVHLSKQTSLPIGLFDIRAYDDENPSDQFDEITSPIVLMDLDHPSQLEKAGAILEWQPFVVGSSGVEQALTAHWKKEQSITPVSFPKTAKASGPVLILCGSCSPVSLEQIDWAASNGFKIVQIGEDVSSAVDALKLGQNTVIHTAAKTRKVASERASQMLSEMAAQIIESINISRIGVAGGDTSGEIAHALKIESLEMVATLTRGSPLCKITAPGSPADGCEITFKGGQIGKPDFFAAIASGL